MEAARRNDEVYEKVNKNRSRQYRVVPLQIVLLSAAPDMYWLSNGGFQWPFVVQQGRYQSKIENRNVNDSSTQFSASDEWCLNFVIVKIFFQ